MNFEFYIAKRIHFSKGVGDNKHATPPVIRIAIAGIAIGLAVMILSVAIVVGFKKEVSNKVIGFDSHIQMTNFDNNNSYQTVPITISDSLRNSIINTDGVKSIEAFVTQPGMIKTEADFQGMIFKGVDYDFDSVFLKKHLVEGQLLQIDSVNVSDKVLISRTTSKILNIKCGDSFNAYFFTNRVQGRKLYVSGIFDTGFIDYDKQFVICDIKRIRRINGWEEDMSSGFGITIDDFNHIDEITEALYFSTINDKDRLGNTYLVRSVNENNPIFSWLSVLDSNVYIILILMIIVSGFTMISGLLIIILERINMIGILKTLGQDNYSIRKVFLYVSFFLISKGLFWGNVVGLSIYFLQAHFHLLKLDEEKYYLNAVPVDISIVPLLLINIGSLIVSMLMMIAPSYLISRIDPAKSVRWE